MKDMYRYIMLLIEIDCTYSRIRSDHSIGVSSLNSGRKLKTQNQIKVTNRFTQITNTSKLRLNLLSFKQKTHFFKHTIDTTVVF